MKKILLVLSVLMFYSVVNAQKNIRYDSSEKPKRNKIKQNYWYINISGGGATYFAPIKYSSNFNGRFQDFTYSNFNHPSGIYIALVEFGKVINQHQIGFRFENLQQLTGFTVLLNQDKTGGYSIGTNIPYTYISANYHYRFFERKVVHIGVGAQIGLGFNTGNESSFGSGGEYNDWSTGGIIYFEEHRNIITHHRVIVNFGPQIRFGVKMGKYKRFELFSDFKLMYTPYSPRVYKMDYIYTHSSAPALNRTGSTEIRTDILNLNYGIGFQYNFRKKNKQAEPMPFQP